MTSAPTDNTRATTTACQSLIENSATHRPRGMNNRMFAPNSTHPWRANSQPSSWCRKRTAPPTIRPGDIGVVNTRTSSTAYPARAHSAQRRPSVPGCMTKLCQCRLESTNAFPTKRAR